MISITQIVVAVVLVTVLAWITYRNRRAILKESTGFIVSISAFGLIYWGLDSLQQWAPTSFSGIFAIGFFYWLGCAATTLVIMGVVAAACLMKNGRLPEQDIPYWQTLLIYLPVEAVPAAVFVLTAVISSAAGVFPLISTTGSGLVGLIAAGAIQVVIATVALWGNDDYQQQSEQRQLSKRDERVLIRQMDKLLRDSENPRENREPRLTVQKRRPGSILRLASSVPVLVLLVLPIVLYVCVQFLTVRA